ncbi:MAG: Ig-like domain-containing protein [Bacteroidales bacterium]|jgi:hypothetical protein|nr:Ig-like domain-containing protein [Bacteroidales bacterium]
MEKSNYFKLLLVFTLVGFICGCTDESNSTITDKTNVDKSSVELYIGVGAGSHSQIQLKSIPEGKQNTWTSLNPNVATVNQTGLVTAVSEGFAVITITSDNVVTSVIVSVRNWIPISNFTLSMDNVSSATMGKFQIVTEINPPDATETLRWSSSDTDVALVDNNGWVTAGRAGSSTITISSASGLDKTVEVAVIADGVMTLREIGIPTDPTAIEPTNPIPEPELTVLSTANWTFPGYNDGSQDETIGYSSQATNEGGSPNGRVTAMLTDDNQFWHARWASPSATYPHWFIVDMEEEEEICAVMLARRDGNNGTSEGYRLYVCPDVPVNQNDPISGYPWINYGNFTFDRNDNAEQIQRLKPPYPTARYVKIYFAPEHRGGAGQYAMFRKFRLYTRAED